MRQAALLQKEFLAQFGDSLDPLGFKRKSWDYYRLTPYGWDMISAEFVSDYHGGFEVELYIALRHDAVEDIINQYSPILPDREKPWTWTIGNRLDNMTRQYVRWRWPVRSQEDVGKAVNAIMKSAVKKLALPFFKRFSDKKEVMRILSRDDDVACRYLMAERARAMTAIAIAFLLDDRKLFQRLVEQKTRFLAGKHKENPEFFEPAVRDFGALAKDLSAQMGLEAPAGDC